MQGLHKLGLKWLILLIGSKNGFYISKSYTSYFVLYRHTNTFWDKGWHKMKLLFRRYPHFFPSFSSLFLVALYKLSSSPKAVITGVPQGSGQSSTHFLCYINDFSAGPLPISTLIPTTPLCTTPPGLTQHHIMYWYSCTLYFWVIPHLRMGQRLTD